MARSTRGAKAKTRPSAKGKAKRKGKTKTAKPRPTSRRKPAGELASRRDRMIKELEATYLGLLSGTPRHIARARTRLDAKP
jgi:hypothetical protein